MRNPQETVKKPYKSHLARAKRKDRPMKNWKHIAIVVFESAKEAEDFAFESAGKTSNETRVYLTAAPRDARMSIVDEDCNYSAFSQKV